jgi:ABC-type uncharacterized transport system permease subunit
VGGPLAVFAGAMRSSTPFLFVSLGELLTEKSGRINLGQEGILVLGAMCGYGIAFLSGSPLARGSRGRVRWRHAGERACSPLQSAAGE